jgi:hypothetical protein
MQNNQVDSTAVYHSIRETARITGLPEYYIRKRLKSGTLPGFYAGKHNGRFLVNVPSLLSMVASEEEGHCKHE